MQVDIYAIGPRNSRHGDLRLLGKFDKAGFEFVRMLAPAALVRRAAGWIRRGARVHVSTDLVVDTSFRFLLQQINVSLPDAYPSPSPSAALYVALKRGTPSTPVKFGA